MRQKSFKESGTDSIRLDVKSKTQDLVRFEIGARSYWECSKCVDRRCFAPYLGLGLVVDNFFWSKSKQRANFRGATCVMDVISYCSAIHMFAPQAGFKYSHCSGFSLIIGYKGLFGDKARVNQGEGRLEWAF